MNAVQHFFSSVVNDQRGSIHAPAARLGHKTRGNMTLMEITYLSIHSQRSICSPPAPVKSWGQPGICQRLSQICPSSSSSTTTTNTTVPVVCAGYCQTSPSQKRKVWARAICSAVPLLPPPRCGAQSLLHDDGMIAFQPTSMRLIRGENIPNQDEEDAMWCLRFKMWCWLWSTSVTYHYYIPSLSVNPLPPSFSLPLVFSPSTSLSLSL